MVTSWIMANPASLGADGKDQLAAILGNCPNSPPSTST
jgi:hypothetical protein